LLATELTWSTMKFKFSSEYSFSENELSVPISF